MKGKRNAVLQKRYSAHWDCPPPPWVHQLCGGTWHQRIPTCSHKPQRYPLLLFCNVPVSHFACSVLSAALLQRLYFCCSSHTSPHIATLTLICAPKLTTPLCYVLFIALYFLVFLASTLTSWAVMESFVISRMDLWCWKKPCIILMLMTANWCSIARARLARALHATFQWTSTTRASDKNDHKS